MSPRPITQTILVIDDSPDFRNLVREALRLVGYRVLEAANGQDGLRLFQEARPDLVLIDMIMPEKHGIETLQEILRMDTGSPIITLSGHPGADEHNGTARCLGAAATFPKPFRLADLLRTVQALLATEPSPCS